MGIGTSELGSVLSFGSIVYGFATGWASYAADYTVYHPRNQSRTNIYFAVWVGLLIPLLFTEMPGIAVMTATTLDDGQNKYSDGCAAPKTGTCLQLYFLDPLVASHMDTARTAIYISIALSGYSHFETVLENFMNFTGYWLAIYEGIAFGESLSAITSSLNGA
ncbi:NCS1 nucleoside transporter [Stagonosporopsis vannaccii]|nr:NCS1 nucleoside transporter [Stagonosporopsis vannaccii]